MGFSKISTQIILHQGTLQPDREKTYLHLPFDVPPGATRIDVEYAYSDRIGADQMLTGGNTIDLGVFDARGIDFLSAGFRGWSGSERASFFIAEDDATPGYLAGPLVAGKWHVMLGLYKVAPGGCSYRVRIVIALEPAERPEILPRVPVGDLPFSMPRAARAPWLRGELHCHTWHSDGDRSPADVVRFARARGLDFCAVTDHNTIASQRELAHLDEPGLVLIRGVEATTFRGHFNIWGIPDWVDFRVQNPKEMQAALQFAKDCGAVTSCNHPKPFGPPWDFSSVTNFDCVEVWNGPWTELNQRALDFWVSLLETGRRLPAVGGSDWHNQKQLEAQPRRAPGIPTVWVHVPTRPSASAILNAIRRGHVVLSSETMGGWVHLSVGDALGGDRLPRPADGRLAVRLECLRGAGCQVRLMDQHKVLFERTIESPDENIAAEVATADSLFVRAELRTPNDGLESLSNPIYLAD